ncbi:fumarylacetoacetate hydrolase family protein [Acidaminobacter hydrogenoformans]|uniref:2-keto-4-pentenoate hydratase/2-oxohepta-3-ene-1,7-dioic acid hydratase (Catechol pathway) n=1 Tax=Acidaminobacter hydrogenoformans DSM 2784 TaxID=1120920 RepID=A0A1G5RR33_9FIRM|nr:fumarylacetoacetate hydrolase family protein [Acidaminobacter hydrogenoformans]SCZ76545.1 2-keto-4-pentenoate hydratase/2-oxohepta-3-ene-1,7-dioic acid hydratase (catechol pathway) [Acidaminobacter hydrogenoformans DSM 2784]
MKFVRFKNEDQVLLGLYNQAMTHIYDLNHLIPEKQFENLNTFIEAVNEDELAVLKEISCCAALQEFPSYSASDVTLLAPIQKTKHDVLCLGLNYKEHVKETAKNLNHAPTMPEHPVYFSKRVLEMMGPDDTIDYTRSGSTQLDYEVELAVIIGKRGRDIPADEAEDYIFGYTILNDLSARDMQARHLQWFKGKSLDGFTPVGPCVVHKSELPLPLSLDLKSYVNGELRQDGNTSDFIFDIPKVIADLSTGMTLEPGDIIATGTPKGVGMGFSPPKYLKAGDEVMCEVEGIGSLRNVIK